MQRRFSRRLQALDDVFRLAEQFRTAEQIKEGTYGVIALTLVELFTNVLKHNPDGSGPVLIELTRDAGSVRIALTDFDAERFDPTKAERPDTEAPIDQRTPGGLGIHLVKQLTDEMRYEYHDRVSKTIVTKTIE